MEMFFPAHRLRQNLRLAGILQKIHAQKGNGAILSDRQRTMIAQDQQALLAQILDQAVPLVQIKRYAFIVMIGQVIMNLHGKLRVAP